MIWLLSLRHSLPGLSATAASLLLASICQGAALAVGVSVLLPAIPKLTAAARSAIWTVVLLLVILVPALSLALPAWPHLAAANSAHRGLLHASESWSLALLSLWAALALLRLSQLLGSALRLQAVARRAVVVTPSQSIAALLRESRRRVELCASPEAPRPSVAGFLRPRILLSPDLLASLSAAELEHVVLHELAHLRRYDDWTNLVQKLSVALVPLHPVLLWLDRRMCVERERACDDRVLRQTGARKAYAACLARLAEDSLVRRGFSLALGALGSRPRASELAGRVHRILGAPPAAAPRPTTRWATAGLLASVLMGAALLSRAPELVSFAPTDTGSTFANAVLAAPAIPSLGGISYQANLLTGSSAGRASTAWLQTVKAVMPEPRNAMLHPHAVSTVSTQQSAGARRTQGARRAAARLARLRTAQLRLARLRTDPRNLQAELPPSGDRLTLTAWQQPLEPTAGDHGSATARWNEAVPQLIPAFAADPRFIYAAVPLRYGWLLIQL